VPEEQYFYCRKARPEKSPTNHQKKRGRSRYNYTHATRADKNMNQLKKTFVLLVLYLLMIFAIDEFYYANRAIFQFPTHFDFLIVIVVFSTLLVPRLRWMSLGALLAFWAIVFGITAYSYIQVNGQGNVQLLFVEFILIEVAVWIAYQVNTQLSLAETIMDNLASSTYQNRTIDMANATDRIDVELTRSRRHNRPMSVLLIEPEKVANENENQQAYQLMRHDLLKHFVEARIGQIITNRARQTDIIIRGHNGRFIILCAETPKENSAVLAERIEESLREGMGASLKWSIASFPDEAVTFDELLQKANEKLTQTPPPASENHANHLA
jgi:GGDEF domain-containing protein